MFGITVLEVGELVGVLAALSVSLAGFRKIQQLNVAKTTESRVEAGSTAVEVVDRSLSVVSSLQLKVQELEDEFKDLRRENQLLRAHNELLSQQVRDRGGTPIPYETVASTWPLDD